MGYTNGSKPHAVCMPLPGQGHIKAMTNLAKLLHFKGFHITFVHTQSNYNDILQSSGGVDDGPPDFRFETLPDGGTTVDLVSFFESMNRHDFLDPFRKLMHRLNDPSSGVPPPTCIVSDSFTSFTLDVAAELGLPDVFFCSVSACAYLGLMHFGELLKRGLISLKSGSDLGNGHLDTHIDWIPGMRSMQLRDLPNFLQFDTIFNFFKDEAQAATRAAAIIINTFDELEGPAIDELSALLPPVYTTGPLNLLCRRIPKDSKKPIGSSVWKEDHGCMEWLDGRAHGSVVYVNFGSVAVFENQEIVEFAWGVANSGHDFLWVMRPDIVNRSDPAALPDELLEEIDGRGFLASWCPQEQVLGHPAVGGFLTHCGWNSTLESISAGVPVLCYPYFADQQTNCRYLCDEWGVGSEIDNEIKREDVSEKIRELMGGEKGKDMRRTALAWKESAERATGVNGPSFLNLERVITEVLLKGKDCSN